MTAGIFPLKIASTRVLTASAVAPGNKEAQKKAAEQVALAAGDEILERIRLLMLEELTQDNQEITGGFELEQLLGEVSINADEEAISSVELGGFAEQYDAAIFLYQENKFADVFVIFSHLAGSGYIRGQNILGVMYNTGYEVEQDIARAVQLFEQGVQEGNAEAEYLLGMMYYCGRNLDRDEEKGLALFEKQVPEEIWWQ